jgi:hypothetical protein
MQKQATARFYAVPSSASMSAIILTRNTATTAPWSVREGQICVYGRSDLPDTKAIPIPLAERHTARHGRSNSAVGILRLNSCGIPS